MPFRLPCPDRQGRNAVLVHCPVPADANALFRLSLPRLCASEREQALRFAFDRDRFAYAAAHLLLRRCLAAPTGRQDWIFHVGAHGKPALPSLDGGSGLDFNLSHCDGLVACALAFGHSVGVDVEKEGRPSDHLAIARHHFSLAEQAALAGMAPEDQASAFLAIWTMKEAVIKADGRGLHMDLGSFSVDPRGAGILFEANSGEDPGQWQLHRARLPCHHLAMAIRIQASPAVRLDIEHVECQWEDLVNERP
jgi:4'-phosphopantetheinyl transferase